MEKVESDFKAFIEKLQKEYKEASDKKEEDIAAVKASGLAMMKKVQASKKTDGKDEL